MCEIKRSRNDFQEKEKYDLRIETKGYQPSESQIRQRSKQRSMSLPYTNYTIGFLKIVNMIWS